MNLHATPPRGLSTQPGAGSAAGLGAGLDAIARARAAPGPGAGCLAFGAFYPATNKAETRHASPALLRDARGPGLSLVAIGGITPDNGTSLVAAGADFLAVIPARFGASDVRATARQFTALFAARKRP